MKQTAVVCLILTSLILSPSALMAMEVKEVKVVNKGWAHADRESVLAFTSVKTGQEFTRSAVSRDVKTLQKTGRFSYVEVLVESVSGGIGVTYLIEAKPLINTIVIEGADYLGNKKVRDLLVLGPGDIVDDSAMAVAAQKVRDE
ncbi:MAG: hypothetical protein V2A34_11740, partial [Lentisphaerota bacterium]